jgi:hypothetical protein
MRFDKSILHLPWYKLYLSYLQRATTKKVVAPGRMFKLTARYIRPLLKYANLNEVYWPVDEGQEPELTFFNNQEIPTATTMQSYEMFARSKDKEFLIKNIAEFRLDTSKLRKYFNLTERKDFNFDAMKASDGKRVTQ